jgi:hypothetical protein
MFLDLIGQLVNLGKATTIEHVPGRPGTYVVTFIDGTTTQIKCSGDTLAEATAPIVPANPGVYAIAVTHDFEPDDSDWFRIERIPVIAWRLRADKYDPESVLLDEKQTTTSTVRVVVHPPPNTMKSRERKYAANGVGLFKPEANNRNRPRGGGPLRTSNPLIVFRHRGGTPPINRFKILS